MLGVGFLAGQVVGEGQVCTEDDIRPRTGESEPVLLSGFTWPSRLMYGRPSFVSGLGQEYGAKLR